MQLDPDIVENRRRARAVDVGLLAVERELRLSPLRWPRRVYDGEALILDAIEADFAPAWLHELLLLALAQASNGFGRRRASRWGAARRG